MINGQRPKILYFRDRATIARDIKLPAQNDHYIIIPPNSSGIGFKWPKYEKVEYFLRDKMPSEVYKQLVEHFYHVGSLEYRNFLRRQNNTKSSRGFKLVLLVALIVNIISFIMFLYITLINREFSNANMMFYFACGLSGCSLLAAIGTNMILCTKKQKFEPFTKVFKKKLKYMCGLANEQTMNRLGLHMMVGKRGLYLEIWRKLDMPDEDYPRPLISIMGRDPFDTLGKTQEQINQFIIEKNKEMFNVYVRPRFNTAKNFTYLNN